MKRFPILAGVLAFAAGCGGAATYTPPQPPAGTKAATARFTVTIPAPPKTTAAAARKPRYISSATNSLSVTPDGGATSVIPLTPTSPGCAANADGSRTCTVNLGLSAGTTTFTVRTFASADGSGFALSLVKLTQTIVADQVNPIAVTLNGVVKTVTIALAPIQSFTAGRPASTNVLVTAVDPANQTIVTPPGALVDGQGNPVTIALTDSDTSGSTKLSSTTVTPGSSTPITLSYNGGTLSSGSSATIGAAAASSAGQVAQASTSAAVQPARSLYVLNGADNTVAEYPLPLPTGTATPAPGRRFSGMPGGTAVGCPALTGMQGVEAFGLDGIAVDPSGTTYLVSDTFGCQGASNATAYEFAPSAGPSTGPGLTFAVDPTGTGHQPAVLYDANQTALDVVDAQEQPGNGQANLHYTFESAFDPRSGQLLGQIAQDWNASPPRCLIPPGGNCATTSYFYSNSYANPNGPTNPAALDKQGNIAEAVLDNAGPLLAANGQLNNPNGLPAIVLVPPTQPSRQSPTTRPVWIEGPATQLSSPVSLAVDGNDVLYVLDGQVALDPRAPGNPQYCIPASGYTAGGAPPASQCTDGKPHYYLLAFDLNQVENGTGACAGVTGACNLPPTFVLGGLEGRFQNSAISAGAGGQFYSGANALAAADGLVYVANPLGPVCDANCQAGTYDTAGGEIDVYSAGTSGTHLGADAQTALVAVLPMNPYVNLPIGLAIGPAGSSTAGINGVRPVPARHDRAALLRLRMMMRPRHR